MALGRRMRGRVWWAALVLGVAGLGCDDRPPPNLPGEKWPAEPSARRPSQAAPQPEPRPHVPAGAKRFAWLISINPDRVEEFRRLHEKIPKRVQQAMQANGIRNYSVFLCGTRDQVYAIRYYDFVGVEHSSDMAELDRDPDYKKWRNACEECEVTLMPFKSGEWWAPSREIAHLDLATE